MTTDIIKRENTEIAEITAQDVKKLINPMATDAEVELFLKICQYEGLNPFRGEIYLIKYDVKKPAAIVTAAVVFLKRATRNPHFKGLESGIILRTKAELEYREGTFYLPEEKPNIVGGWARVYRDDMKKPYYVAVNRQEVEQSKGDGSLNRFWNTSPAWMLDTCAVRRVCKRAFPEDTADLDDLPTGKEIIYREIKDGTLPQAFMLDSNPNWDLFWLKQSERGLSHEDVHNILQVESMNEWLQSGFTLEEAHEKLTDFVEKRNAEQSKDDLFDNARNNPLHIDKGQSQTASKIVKKAPAKAKAVVDTTPPAADTTVETPEPPANLDLWIAIKELVEEVKPDMKGVSQWFVGRKIGGFIPSQFNADTPPKNWDVETLKALYEALDKKRKG